MPRSISYLEEEVRKVVSSKLKRGKVDIFITFNNNSCEGKDIKINKEIAKVYIKELRELAKEENIQANIEVTDVSKMPDVLQIINKEDDDKIKEELNKVVDIALDNLIEMRIAEGKKMASDIENRLRKISSKVEEISTLSTGLIDEYVVKLEDRIKELLKEITRLGSHITQLRKLLHTDKAVGKQIDFLIQEMNRETNTIGSKANNLEITNSVIVVKTEIEDIREQVQNIE